MSIRLRPILVLLGFVGLSSAHADGLFDVNERLWTPQVDAVYLQEIGSRVTTGSPVTSVATEGGRVFAVVDGRIHELDGDQLRPVPDSPDSIVRVKAAGGSVWALGESGTHQWDGEAWERVDGRAYVDVCEHRGAVHAATRDEIYHYANGAFKAIMPEEGYKTTNTTYIMEDGSQVLPSPVRWGTIQRITAYSDTLYALTTGGLALLDGDVINKDFVDWGALPSPVTRDMLRRGSRVYVATDRGLGVLRGAALTALDSAAGLPVEDTTCLAAGFDGDLWIGTTRGAIRYSNDGAFHYFGAELWLPDNRVHDIAVAGNTVYIATGGGLAIIRYEPYTLRKKAAHYEHVLDAWGHLRLGFVHKLFWAGDEQGWIREISDNDGGHTADYLAAMCYKYAVTGDPEARAAAVNAFEAMVWLETITPVEGFIARAIWSPADEHGRSERGSGGLPAKWYETGDGWWWKGDTSSDEVTAHFYSVSIFHDLVAEGREKELAARHLARIASHIIDNGWVLRDMDGEPTRWGRWDPEYLQRPYGYSARGLNGMEAQTYMTAAYAVSGNRKFQAGLEQLIDRGYHKYTVRQKLTFPPEDVVPWDDHLAFQSYYTLLRYVEDPYLRSIYRRSLERSWEVKRMEHVALYDFIYGAISGNDCEADRAAQYLREWPLDPIGYSYSNSHRRDLRPEPGYVPYGGGTRAMSAREVAVKRGTRSMLPYDGGGGGRSIDEPTGFVLDYWMGRYHGFITPPQTTDPSLISVSPGDYETEGAKPYDGPPRPAIR